MIDEDRRPAKLHFPSCDLHNTRFCHLLSSLRATAQMFISADTISEIPKDENIF